MIASKIQFLEILMNRLVGTVLKIFISNINTKRRASCEKILLDSGGIIGDKYHNIDKQRSVLLTSVDSYNLLQSHKINTTHGILGENLLIDYNPYLLKPGTILQIGTTHLEISQYCTICQHLSSIDKKVPKLLEKDRGIFAKVIKDGKITLNDKIFLVK